MTKKYCECCGRKFEEIREEIEIREELDEKEEWKGHKKIGGSIVGELKTRYCEYCGEKLDDEDIKIGIGGMPRELIVTGYECKNCNKVVDF